MLGVILVRYLVIRRINIFFDERKCNVIIDKDGISRIEIKRIEIQRTPIQITPYPKTESKVKMVVKELLFKLKTRI